MYTWGYIKDVSLAKLDLGENEATVQNLLSRFPFYANEAMTQICSTVKPKYTFAHFAIKDIDVGTPMKMPEDFISFGDDVSYELVTKSNYPYPDSKVAEELHDDDFNYHGYNEVVFLHEGDFYISYNARWYTFDKEMDNNIMLDVPTDILDCIPSYIASQCYKIDDEYKAQVFRNEFELAMARIDNSNYKNTQTIKIRGDW